jgi:hypothetical protein
MEAEESHLLLPPWYPGVQPGKDDFAGTLHSQYSEDFSSSGRAANDERRVPWNFTYTRVFHARAEYYVICDYVNLGSKTKCSF